MAMETSAVAPIDGSGNQVAGSGNLPQASPFDSLNVVVGSDSPFGGGGNASPSGENPFAGGMSGMSGMSGMGGMGGMSGMSGMSGMTDMSGISRM